MSIVTRIRLSLERMNGAWRDALATAIAGALAWLLANWLLGHPHPVFAIVTAIVCLAPGLPNHGRQATGLMLGVAIGILMGELALQIPETMLEAEPLALLRMSAAVFLSILIASVFGLPAVVPIQAGVSAVLVLAMGAENAGWHRMEDVIVGAGAGLLFSQILLTPDPLRQIDSAMAHLLLRIGAGLEAAAEALHKADPRRAETTLGLMLRAQEDLALLRAGADGARYSARWSLRGRLAAASVISAADDAEHDAIRLCAAALLLADGLREALLQGKRPPGELESSLRALAALSSGKATGPLAYPGHSSPQLETIAPDWMPVVSSLRVLSEILRKNALPGRHQKVGKAELAS